MGRASNEEAVIATGEERTRAAGRKRSPDSHRAILAATRELLVEVGYHRLTVEGVAARAGVGKTTVYRWWPSKSALVLEAVSDAQTPVPKPSGDVRVDLRAAMEATLEGLSGPFAETLLALVSDLSRDASEETPPLRIFQSARDDVAAIIEDAAGRGDLPADVDVPLLQGIYTGTLLYAVLSNEPTTGVVDKLLDLLLDGTIPRRSLEPEAH